MLQQPLTSQQYFSLTPLQQQPPTSQQYFPLIPLQQQPPAPAQRTGPHLLFLCWLQHSVWKDVMRASVQEYGECAAPPCCFQQVSILFELRDGRHIQLISQTIQVIQPPYAMCIHAQKACAKTHHLAFIRRRPRPATPWPC